MEAWDRDEVQFTGEFKPSSKDEQVKVVIEAGPRSLEIRGEYPKYTGWGSYQGPQCQMTLKVPRRVAPTLETVNGEIAVSGIQGATRVNTVNGGIRASNLTEILQAKTVNGSITLDQVEVKKHRVTAVFLGSEQTIEVDTVNGAITFN